MSLTATDSAGLAARANLDGEFRLAARYWNGGLRLTAPGYTLALTMRDGLAMSADPGQGAGVLTLSGPLSVWSALLEPVPARFVNDIQPLLEAGLLELDGDALLFAQYYPALMRAIELLRPADQRRIGVATEAPRAPAQFDTPVGRYIHLDIEGQDYRIYFETAGTGIPLLLQHTAGCHGVQWRHLFECKAITDRFQLIAYDLPFHGKSLPPVGTAWWAEEYKLRSGLVRALPIALSQALSLERPVFMGCSVGGVLALDLARHHPEQFRAVISLEGVLNIDYDIAKLGALNHPQVSNEYKARAMQALMSPTSPEAYRKETAQVYAAGWPPLFLGDLHYYMVEYDLRAEAHKIDTSKVAVHILSGEYDFSGTIEGGRAAHEAIAGSTFTPMQDVGHFPMSENPQKFIDYLLPVLAQIDN